MQCIALFLACNKGRYGLNCSQVCGHCKENTHCHHISGLCDWGCDTGYRGNQCTQSKFHFVHTKNMNYTTMKQFEQELKSHLIF